MDALATRGFILFHLVLFEYLLYGSEVVRRPLQDAPIGSFDARLIP